MRKELHGFTLVLLIVMVMRCSNPTNTTPERITSSSLFDDGETVTIALDDGMYTNRISGVGDGEVTYTSSIEATATVNENTGEVTPVGVGTTIITANKTATSTHGPVSSSYTLTVTATLQSSSILFEDGTTVIKMMGSSMYINRISGVGDGEVTFTSSIEATATVNEKTGEVTLLEAGTTIITANKASTTTHLAVSAHYSLVVVALPTMILVPAGSFQRDGIDSNISVITSSYKMSQNEVSMEQFMAVTGLNNPDMFSNVKNGPAHTTTFYHALIFCNKLSMLEGLTPAYIINGSSDPDDWGSIPFWNSTIWNAVICDWSATGYRLPTNMEWMWAAMGATSDRSNGYTGTGVNTTGYLKGYAGSLEKDGDQVNMCNYVWYATNSDKIIHPVGTKMPNELGLFDMTGNVWEWCWDLISHPNNLLGTVYSNTVEGRGATSGDERVRRGGGCLDSGSYCKVLFFNFSVPYYENCSIGFRVVRQ